MFLKISERNVVFVLMIFIAFSVICRYYNTINIGMGGEQYIQYMLYFETLLSLPLYIYTYKNYSSCMYKSSNKWIRLVGVYVVLDVLNAILFADAVNSVIPDMVFWLFFISMFYMGSSEKMWGCFASVSLGIMLLTSYMSIREITTLAFNYLRENNNPDSYIYGIQMGFAPVTFVLVFFLLKNYKYQTMLSLGIFGLNFILQFFFQKRLPLFRMFLFILLLVYLINTYKYICHKKILLCLIAVSAIISLSLIPNEYYSATLDRFRSEGSISKTTSSDDRYLFCKNILERSLDSPTKLLFGHGTGSAILGDFGDKQVKVNGRMVNGVTSIEIGAVTIISRYGVIFFFLIYGYICKILTKYKTIKNNPLSLACWSYLLIFFVMSIIGESFPEIDTPITTLLVAGSIGYLSCPSSRIKIL